MRIGLARERHDWTQYKQRNKGLIMAEKDFNYPGGFYIRHKDAGRFCIAGSRWDFENLAENIMAALETNCGRIIVSSEEEIVIINQMKNIVFQGLDKHIKKWVDDEGIGGDKDIKMQVFMDIMWRALADIRVNERAPSLKKKVAENIG